MRLWSKITLTTKGVELRTFQMQALHYGKKSRTLRSFDLEETQSEILRVFTSQWPKMSKSMGEEDADEEIAVAAAVVVEEEAAP